MEAETVQTMQVETEDGTTTECDVCGGEHQTEYCPELGLADPGTILEFVSRARLTLPDTMQLIELTDGTLGVCSKIQIPPKTQLGPFEAKRTGSDIEASDFFILKMFNKDGSVTCFDSSDENECNWMCLIRPADNEVEQNCMAYTINHNVFYSTTRDIVPSEELRVWYAPHYAKKLGREPKPNGTTKSMLGAMVVTESPEIPIKEEPVDNGYPAGAIPPGTTIKIEAIHECDTCGEKFDNESDFAKHIRKHLIPPVKKGPFQCKRCPNKYKSLEKLQQHMLTHSKQHICFVCNFKANSQSNLKFHMDTKHSSLKTTKGANSGIAVEDDSNSASVIEDPDSVRADVDIKEAAEGMMSLIKSAASKAGDNGVESSIAAQETDALAEDDDPGSPIQAVEEFTQEEPVKTPKKRGRKPKSQVTKEPPKPKAPSLGTVMIKVEPPDPDCPPARIMPRRSLKGRRTTGKFADPDEKILSPLRVKAEKPENGEYDAAKKGKGRPKKVEEPVQKPPKEPEPEIPPEEIDEYLDDEAADVDFQPSEEHTKEVHDEDKEISEEEEEEEEESDDEVDLDESEDFKAPRPQKRGRKRKYKSSSGESGKKRKYIYSVRPGRKREDTVQQEISELEKLTEEIVEDDGTIFYKCGVCGKKYSMMNYLRLHLPAHTDIFKCDDCGKRFTRNESFQKHRCRAKAVIYYIKDKENEEDDDIFCCAVCDKEFTEHNFVVKHHASHSSKLKCKICETVFDNEEEFNSHSGTDCKGKLESGFSCALCKQMFSNEMSLYRHMAMHTDLYKCDKCGKCYSRKDSWQGHILRCNPDKINDHKIYVCHNCKKTFATELGAQNHMVNCAKHYCSECRTAFENEEHLKAHECDRIINNTIAVQFQCPVCKKTFSSFTYLKRHEATHQGAFQCKICNKGFSRREEHGIHYRYCLGQETIKKEGKINCDVCDVPFHDAKEYRNHIHEHTHPHKCEICKRRFIKIGSLHNHKCDSVKTELENDVPEPCKECGKVFHTKQAMMKHIITHREPEFSCQDCGKKFYRKDYARDHICVLPDGTRVRVNRKSIQPTQKKEDVVCHECGKSFNTVSNLNKHVKTHGEKRYACDVCGKRFHYEAYVRVHREMVHEKKYTYQCNDCGKVLTSKQGLISHNRQFHTENPPTYHCPTCKRGFKQRGNLRTHMLMHGNEKNYGCNICGQYFKYPEQRNRHKLEHTMTEKFKCGVCQKTFVRQYDMKRHMSEMHSGHIYICTLCNERCSHRPTLIRHYKRKHPGNMDMVRDQESINSMKRSVTDFPVEVKQVKEEPKDNTLLYEAVHQLEQAGLVESGHETTYITHLDSGEDIILPQEAAEALQGLSNAVITTNQMGEETITIPSSIQSAFGGENHNGEQTVVILQIINPEDGEAVEEEVVDSSMIQYIEGGEGITQETEGILVDQGIAQEGISEEMAQPGEGDENAIVEEGVTEEGEEETIMEIPEGMEIQIQEVPE